MAATPYPTDYVYAGNAVALTLKTAVSDGGGDLTLTVNEETAAKGWPSLGAGQRLVIVVGRGTAYETKYAVKTITSSAAGSTLVVDSADKTFDNTPVTSAPAGTVVEHCWSATEASLANDHMRTKQAHGSDGDLVDQNTAQLLSNKTVMTPTASGHPTTKAYVDAADALLLPKAGGTMSGAIAMGGAKITGLGNGTASGDAVNLGQLAPTYAIGTRTTNQTIAATATNDVTYPSEDDPSSILASGIVTFPSAGVYSLTAWVQCTGATFIGRAYLLHGSTTLASVDLSTYSNQYGVNMSATVRVAASDTAKVQVWNISPSDVLTISAARFTAVKIGT